MKFMRPSGGSVHFDFNWIRFGEKAYEPLVLLRLYHLRSRNQSALSEQISLDFLWDAYKK